MTLMSAAPGGLQLSKWACSWEFDVKSVLQFQQVATKVGDTCLGDRVFSGCILFVVGLISFGIVVVVIVCKGFFIVEVCIVRVNLIYLHMYKMV